MGNEAAESPSAAPQEQSGAESTPAAGTPAAPVAPTGWPVAYPMAPAPQSASPAQPPVPPQQPAALPTYAAAPLGAQTSSSAIVALVLAIASWAVCPFIFAIVALVFASKADREIQRSGGSLEGGGLSTAAKIVAWINIGVTLAAVVVVIVIVIVIAIAGGLEQITQSGQV